MLEKVKKLLYSDEEYEYAETEEEVSGEKSSKSVRLNKMKVSESEVVISEPLSYSESQSIADYILSNRSMIINLHRVTPDQAKRIIDFMSGTIYAINGTIQKIGDDIFLITPSSVHVSGVVENSQVEID